MVKGRGVQSHVCVCVMRKGHVRSLLHQSTLTLFFSTGDMGDKGQKGTVGRHGKIGPIGAKGICNTHLSLYSPLGSGRLRAATNCATLPGAPVFMCHPDTLCRCILTPGKTKGMAGSVSLRVGGVTPACSTYRAECLTSWMLDPDPKASATASLTSMVK